MQQDVQSLPQTPAPVNDAFNLNRFDLKNIEHEVNRLSGLDALVYQYLLGEGRLTPMLIRQSFMTVISDGISFHHLMLTQGIIKNDELIQVSLNLSPAELAKKELIDPTIPAELLKKHKIKLSAVTEKTVFLSTLRMEMIAKLALEPYFPYHDFYFTPVRSRDLVRYLEKTERYSKMQGTLLEVLIRKAIRRKVSDIHVLAGRDGFTVKFREHGDLTPEMTGSIEDYNLLVGKAKTEARLDPADRRSAQDGKFSIDSNGIMVDIRVSTLPVINQRESLVLRILNPENSQVQFKDLGITRIDELTKAFKSVHGVVLVCGITGSGKTTTIGSALRWVFDRYTQAINSVEDPVENEIPDVKQTAVDPRSGLTFAKALRAILRQDPDVVSVGEVRDNETADIIFMGADTGHMMIGTLHVGDIRGVVSRLLGLGVDIDQILNQLRGVIIQGLIKTVCQSCRGDGCVQCHHKGYTGRTVVSECVYLKDRETVQRLADYNEPRWWDTILDDAYFKYRQGITDRREMVNAFSTQFLEYEDECAKNDLVSVKAGVLSRETFAELYPAHVYLIQDESYE